MPLNGLAGTTNINTYVGLANSTPNLVNPEVFYSKQLLDTIRYDADAYVYFRLADETPIQDKADKLILRRWAPLQAHTTPLTEGVPPISDKGSVEKYEISAKQYGRYMEFTDKVDFNVVDPVVAHYTREYTLVAMETLDLLAKEVLLAQAQKYYAGGAADFEGLTLEAKPTMTDLRMIIMAMKKALVKPRSNGRFHVIGSPEFYYDMISDPTVEKYMTINNSTETMYSNSKLVPMFDMEFYETPTVPTSGRFVKNSTEQIRIYEGSASSTVNLSTVSFSEFSETKAGYVLDSRTQLPASYLPEKVELKLGPSQNEFKAQHILIVGKDALTRTGLAGEGQAKVYVKQKGSAGVLDPIDQRQSIGFKINSVGFGSTRPEAICDYICVPSLVNTL